MVRGIHHIEGRKVKENEQNISYVKKYHHRLKIDFLESIKEYFAKKEGTIDCHTNKKHKTTHQDSGL